MAMRTSPPTLVIVCMIYDVVYGELADFCRFPQLFHPQRHDLRHVRLQLPDYRWFFHMRYNQALNAWYQLFDRLLQKRSSDWIILIQDRFDEVVAAGQADSCWDSRVLQVPGKEGSDLRQECQRIRAICPEAWHEICRLLYRFGCENPLPTLKPRS